MCLHCSCVTPCVTRVYYTPDRVCVCLVLALRPVLFVSQFLSSCVPPSLLATQCLHHMGGPLALRPMWDNIGKNYSVSILSNLQIVHRRRSMKAKTTVQKSVGEVLCACIFHAHVLVFNVQYIFDHLQHCYLRLSCKMPIYYCLSSFETFIIVL